MNRKLLIIAVLLLVTSVSIGFGATLYSQRYRYIVGTGLSGKSQIDFGSLVPGVQGETRIVSALSTGNVNGPITITFVNAETTWDRVFTGVRIEVRTQNATNPVPVACIARGSLACVPTTLDARFRPPGTPTSYDYWITYVVIGNLPASAPTLETYWGQ